MVARNGTTLNRRIAVARRARAHTKRDVAAGLHPVAYTIVDSPVGRLLVAATERGICSVKLGDSDAALEGALRREFPAAARDTPGPPKEWIEALLAHLAGAGPRVELPVDVRGTPFQQRVWEALRAIPSGSTRSYAAVARAIGRPRAVRAVAQACATNPVALVVPCHRVVRQSGELGGYRWGVERKAVLLEAERAAVLRAERGILAAFLATLGDSSRADVRPVGPTPLFAPGQVVAGRYEIIDLLGSGGMGVVYRARDRELDEVVALKALRPERTTADPHAVERFRRELRLARRVSHPNVVRTHDIGEASGYRFITMEHVEGRSLADVLERAGRLPAAVTVGPAKPVPLVARALDGGPRPPRELAPGTPERLSHLVLSALASEREDRPGSATELHDLLAESDAAPA